MSFRDILGHDRALALLRGALASGRLPHALLFHGPEGVGKATVARRLAMAFLCEAGGGSGEGCGHCAVCLRVERGLHPGFLVVGRLPAKRSGKGLAGPEPAEASEVAEAGEETPALRKEILVDQIRDMSEHAAFAPREGRGRVFVVDAADRMNLAAQNALLKTLEEPAGRSVFVLVTARPRLLLPTIRSRCVAVAFAPLAVGELAESLARRGMPAEEARARAELAAGRPGLALRLDVGASLERREAAVRALDTLAGSREAAGRLPAFAADLAGSSEEDFVERLEVAASLLRDAARACLDPASAPPAGGAQRLASIGRRIGPARAYEIVRSIERLRGELRFNLNRTLAAEALLAAVAGGPVPR